VGDQITGIAAGAITSIGQEEQGRPERLGYGANVSEPGLSEARLKSRQAGQGDTGARGERGQSAPAPYACGPEM